MIFVTFSRKISIIIKPQIVDKFTFCTHDSLIKYQTDYNFYSLLSERITCRLQTDGSESVGMKLLVIFVLLLSTRHTLFTASSVLVKLLVTNYM